MQRVRDYIRFVDGKTSTKPAMADALDDELGEIDQWTVPSIVELFKESRKLSECIYATEMELRCVDKLLEQLDKYKTDNENYAKQLSVRAVNALRAYVRSDISARLFGRFIRRDNTKFPTRALTPGMNRVCRSSA